MKNTIMIMSLLLLASCSGRNEYGECVGLASDKKPNLKYEVSVRNAFWSVVGFQTIIAPILWATDYVYCPIARVQQKNGNKS